jgi:hypothetical protein
MDSCQYAASGCTSHTLPMTGLDLVFFVGLAVALIALGLSLRYSR